MLSWLTFTIVAATADPLCTLQPNAVWNNGPRDVSALVCRGAPGFFVPSAAFRELHTQAQAGDIAAQALELSKQELDEQRAIRGSLERDMKAARAERDGWLKEADRCAEALDEASERSWFESPALWFLAGVTITAVGLLFLGQGL